MTMTEGLQLPPGSRIKHKSSGIVGRIARHVVGGTVVEWDDGQTGVIVFAWQWSWMSLESRP